MNYSNQTIQFAKSLVSQYAKWDSANTRYLLNINNIPDFHLHEFAQRLMSDDASLACESTGYDNPLFATHMLPSLMSFLQNSTDRDKEIKFVEEWREGVTSYFYDAMQEIINDICSDRLHSEMNDNGFYAKRDRNTNELYWGRI